MKYFIMLVCVLSLLAISPVYDYPLLAETQTVQAGAVLDVVGVWDSVTPTTDYDRIVCAVFDGYTWREFDCTMQTASYTQKLYNFNFGTNVNDKIVDLAIGCSYIACEPVVRRWYVDDGSMIDSPFGVGENQLGYVSPYYAQIIRMSEGLYIGPKDENQSDYVPQFAVGDLLPSIPNPFNSFSDSFNNWRSWIDINFLSKLQFDTTPLQNLKPWLLFFAGIMLTLSPIIPVELLVTVVAMVTVISNLTILLSIYDRIRKLLI